METLGARIRDAAANIGGLDRLSELLTDISRRSLSDYVSGKTDPKVSVLHAIAQHCSVDFGWLATGIGRPTGPDEPAPNPDLLRRAIELVEIGLAEANRTTSPSGKAEMVTAAYEMLKESGDRAAPRILQLLK